jgi:hypothetical protein
MEQAGSLDSPGFHWARKGCGFALQDRKPTSLQAEVNRRRAQGPLSLTSWELRAMLNCAGCELACDPPW